MLVIVEEPDGLDDVLPEVVEVSVRVSVLVADVVEDGEPLELDDELEVNVTTLPVNSVAVLMEATFMFELFDVNVTTLPVSIVAVLMEAIVIDAELVINVTTLPVSIVAVLMDEIFELKLTIFPEILATKYLVETEFDV